MEDYSTQYTTLPEKLTHDRINAKSANDLICKGNSQIIIIFLLLWNDLNADKLLKNWIINAVRRHSQLGTFAVDNGHPLHPNYKTASKK